MKSVFILHHIHNYFEDEEDVKLIGAYASNEEAKIAIERLRNKPGFKDDLLGFEISEYELGKDHWADGYISWEEASEQKTKAKDGKPRSNSDNKINKD